MRGLKVLVIVQGVLIVVGVVALVFVLVHRIGRTGAEIVANAPSQTVPLAGGPVPASPPANAGGIPLNPAFVTAPPATLALPAGSSVLGMVGAGPYVVLRIGMPAGEELLTLDPATGNTVKIVAVKPAAP